MKRRRAWLTAGAVAGAWAGVALMVAAAGPAPIRLADGYFDDLTLIAPDRVAIGRGGGIDVLALGSGRVSHVALAGRYFHAILAISAQSLLVTDGGAGAVLVLDRQKFSILRRIALGGHPDAAAFDAGSGKALVLNAAGTGGWLFDPARAGRVAPIALDGRPEGAAADGQGRILVNIADHAEIEAVDAARAVVVARMALPGCDGPSGLGVDPAAHLAVAACDNGEAVGLDTRSGAVRFRLPIGRGADAVIPDPAHARFFVPCGESGVVEFITHGQAGWVAHAVASARGARTGAYAPAFGVLVVPAVEAGPELMRQFGEQVAAPRPGTLRLLRIAVPD